MQTVNRGWRSIAIALAVIVLGAMTLVATPGAAQQLLVEDPTDTTLNLRAGPGAGHAVVMRMQNGTAVALLGTQGDWAQVRLGDGRTGWAWHPFLIEERAGVQVLMTVAHPDQAEIEVRNGPGARFRLLRHLPNGTDMLLVDWRGDWAWARRPEGGALGWVYLPHLTRPEPDWPEPDWPDTDVLDSHAELTLGAPIVRMVVANPGLGWLYLHEYQDARSEALGRWADGTEVDVFEFDGDWAFVSAPDGVFGWMSRLSLAPAAVSPPIATPPAIADAVSAPQPILFAGTREIRTTGMGEGQSLSHGSVCNIRFVIDTEGQARLIFEACDMAVVDIGPDRRLAAMTYPQPRRVHVADQVFDLDDPGLSARIAAWLEQYFQSTPNLLTVSVRELSSGFLVQVTLDWVAHEGFMFREESIILLERDAPEANP